MPHRPEDGAGGAAGPPHGWARRRPPTEHPGRNLTGWQWVFRSRATGRVSVAAWPNLTLWVWIATAVTRRLPSVRGRAEAVLVLIGTGALVAWAVGELWHGVNPWRRLLGFGVLVGVVISATVR